VNTIIRILLALFPLNAILAICAAIWVAIDGDYIGATIALLACPLSLFMWTIFSRMDREYRAMN